MIIRRRMQLNHLVNVRRPTCRLSETRVRKQHLVDCVENGALTIQWLFKIGRGPNERAHPVNCGHTTVWRWTLVPTGIFPATHRRGWPSVRRCTRITIRRNCRTPRCASRAENGCGYRFIVVGQHHLAGPCCGRSSSAPAASAWAYHHLLKAGRSLRRICQFGSRPYPDNTRDIFVACVAGGQGSHPHPLRACSVKPRPPVAPGFGPTGFRTVHFLLVIDALRLTFRRRCIPAFLRLSEGPG